MIKSSVLVFCFVALFQDGNSQETIGSGFFGGCPEANNALSTTRGMSGRWYTQWVSFGDYSPLKYFPCFSHVLDLLMSGSARIVTKFSSPVLRTPHEIVGELQAKDVKTYTFNYNFPIFGNVPQKSAILMYRPSSDAILLWTCTDFKFFHFESTQVMTRVQGDNSGSNVNDQAFTSMSYSMNKYGLAPESFVKVDQSCR